MRHERPNRAPKPIYAVIGEGPVESIYFESIKNEFRHKLAHCVIEPRLYTSNMEALGKIIDGCKKKEYDKILCIIDMDTKLRNQAEKDKYQALIKKHERDGNIQFFETHPCTELWFFYHFGYTTKLLDKFEPHVKRLIRTKIRDYEKKSPYCTHSHICKCGGRLEKAITNGRASMKSKVSDSRNYTYSDMAGFFEEIGLLVDSK